MNNDDTSDDTEDAVAAAKGSKAAASAAGERHLEDDYKRSRRRKLSYETTSDREGRRRTRTVISVGIVVGGGLVFAIATWLIQRNDAAPATPLGPTTTTTASPSPSHPATTVPTSMTTGAIATASGSATTLTVQGTLMDPGGEGVWIRACYDTSPCERRALAAEHQPIYAACRVEGGMDVFGDTTWVKTPWVFTGPIPQDQPVRAESTGHSDPSSSDYGWATAHYLAPRAAIDALPACAT